MSDGEKSWGNHLQIRDFPLQCLMKMRANPRKKSPEKSPLLSMVGFNEPPLESWSHVLIPSHSMFWGRKMMFVAQTFPPFQP
jgi:hypothetical protein